jgi:hypothetical protein
MAFSPDGISEADWLATPSAVKALILAQQEELQAQRKELQQLRAQISTMATELANRPRPFAWCKTRGPNALIQRVNRVE